MDPRNESADAAGQRFYKLETLGSAFEKAISGRDAFLKPSLSMLGETAAPVSVQFAFEGETVSELRFNVQVRLRNKKSVRLLLVAAKNAEELSSQIRRRLRALEYAYDQGGKGSVLRVLRHGKVFLPDRHRRKDQGREIVVYVAAYPTDFESLVVDRKGALSTVGAGRRVLSKRDEMAVVAQLVGIAARSYDPRRQTGIRLPVLDDRQVLVRRGGKKGPEVLLAAPEGLRTRMTVPRFLHELVTWEARSAERTHRLRLDSATRYLAVLSEAVGVETAKGWLARYRTSVSAGKLPGVPPLTPDDLEEIGVV